MHISEQNQIAYIYIYIYIYVYTLNTYHIIQFTLKLIYIYYTLKSDLTKKFGLLSKL